MRILVLGGRRRLTLVDADHDRHRRRAGHRGHQLPQTIKAYPHGASSYIVASDNLGTLPGLTAAAALLIDYVLTVAVSVSAGVAAITSIVPSLLPDRVLIAVAIVVVLMLGNLRGIRESGTHLHGADLPVHRGLRWRCIAWGCSAFVTGDLGPVHAAARVGRGPTSGALGVLGLFLILRAFSSGRGGPDRGRGRLRRRPGLQAAGVEERAHHADLGGRHLRRPLPRHQLPGQHPRAHPRPDEVADRPLA